MLRVAVCMSVVLAGAPAWAGAGSLASLPDPDKTQPTQSLPGRSIDLSTFNPLRSNVIERQQGGLGLPQSSREALPPSEAGLQLGPIQTEYQRQNGRHAQFARFRLNGVTVLGASVSGSIDGRSAHFVLSWPTSP